MPAPVGETRPGSTLAGMCPREFTPRYLDALEAWTGETPAVLVFFRDMEQSGEGIAETVALLETIWERGSVPLLFWQPNFGAAADVEQSVTGPVAAGEYDDRIDAWASALAEWLNGGDDGNGGSGAPRRRLYLNLAPEFNGDWVPWGVPTPETTPESYVAMWRRIHDRVMATGLRPDQVQWMWTANNYTSGPLRIRDCYPGDHYVDWVAVTGYSWERWGGWKSPAEVFDGMLATLRSFTDRPVAFAEFGASADCGDDHCPDRKNAYVTDVYDYMAENDVRMACWFDQYVEKDGTDWGVFDAEAGPDVFRHAGRVYRTYDEYASALARPTVLGAHPVDARRLTDAEFDGSFAEMEPSTAA